MKNILVMLCGLLFSANVFSENCPSVADIKANRLQTWKAYDSEDGKLISDKRLTRFVNLVEDFVLAEWLQKKHTAHGSIRCYYRDKNGSNLYVYLGKENFRPNNAKNYWYHVSGLTQCAAGTERCRFNAMGQPQYLARK